MADLSDFSTPMSEAMANAAPGPYSGTGGAKHDGGKPPMHLIAWDAVRYAMLPGDIEGDHFEQVQAGLSAWWHGSVREALVRELLSCAFWASLCLAGDGSPWRGLIQVARVLDFGAKKYAPRNWEKGLPHSRTFAAAQRHFCARAAGEIEDPETGLDHYAHGACEIMFALAFEVRGRKDLDDRPHEAARPAALPCGTDAMCCLQNGHDGPCKAAF